MTTMTSEVYDAFKDTNGVSEEKARKAAEAVAQFDTRFNKIEAEMMLQRWMIGILYPMIIAILLKLFVHA